MEKVKDENAKIKKDFSSRINALEQRTRINNVEIVGLKKPSLMETDATLSISLINELTEADITSDDIEALHEVPTRRKDNKRIVVVHFKSRNKRDSLLKQCKSALRLRNTNLSPENRIYINEHLSPENKRLFAMTTQKKIEFNYKFLWSKNGIIFLKRDEQQNATFHKITCEDDLTKVIS